MFIGLCAAAGLGILAFALSGGALLFAALLTRKGIENSRTVGTGGGHGTGIVPATEDSPMWWNAQRNSGKIEELAVTSGSVRLNGYLLPPDSDIADGTDIAVVLLHGYAGCAAGMSYLSREYHRRGAFVLSVDCRAAGKSEGKVVGMGYSDAKDIPLWLEVLYRRLENARVVVHGVSTGADAAILFAGSKNCRPEKLAAVVADCAFASGTERLQNMLKKIFGAGVFQTPVARILVFGMSVINFIVAGFFFFQNSPKNALKKRAHTKAGEVPLVLFHGSRDKAKRNDTFDKLLKAAGGKNVAAHRIEGGGRNGCYFCAPQTYMQIVFTALGQ